MRSVNYRYVAFGLMIINTADTYFIVSRQVVNTKGNVALRELKLMLKTIGGKSLIKNCFPEIMLAAVFRTYLLILIEIPA